jgi:hypothetical protein
MADGSFTPEEVRRLLAELQATVERSRVLIEQSDRINRQADEISRQLARVLQAPTKK